MLPHDGRVVSNFIVQALKGNDITVFGDGKQTRSFCYVDDIIDGLIKCMETDNSFTGPVNLGQPTEIQILELAHKVIKLTGSKSKIVYKPLPSDDPAQRQPDLTLAKQKLRWEPKVGLEEGLERTCEYFKGILKISR